MGADARRRDAKRHDAGKVQGEENIEKHASIFLFSARHNATKNIQLQILATSL